MSILGQKFSCPHISDDFRLGADWQQRRESERRIVTLEDDWVYWNCPAPPDGEAWSLPFLRRRPSQAAEHRLLA